jgi:hypothetical protein
MSDKKSRANSRTRRWKGSLRIRSSVDFWYLLISRRATVPGLYLLWAWKRVILCVPLRGCYAWSRPHTTGVVPTGMIPHNKDPHSGIRKALREISCEDGDDGKKSIFLPVGLLHSTTRGAGLLACGLAGQGLAGSLASCGLAGSLLGSSHHSVMGILLLCVKS